jgi:hypothetical protein
LSEFFNVIYEDEVVRGEDGRSGINVLVIHVTKIQNHNLSD